jgi:CO dehydrogenase nickel-insertion accessory protein CooC1
MKHIIINGRGTSGKDTFIELFAKSYPNTTHNISSIDPIKDIAYIGG